MLWTFDESGGAAAPLLLVGEGKRGIGEVPAELDGRFVEVRGDLIERGAPRLLTLSGASSIELRETESSVPPGFPAKESLGPTTLRGSIFDPKCYFGAMKPGEGEVHKACATLCISGGIPPMFMTVDPTGRRSYFLITGTTGEPLREPLLEFVADPVEVDGVVWRRGDLLLFGIDPSRIRRLP